MCLAAVESGHSAAANMRRPMPTHVLSRSGMMPPQTLVSGGKRSPVLSLAQRRARYQKLKTQIQRLMPYSDTRPHLRPSHRHLADAPPGIRLYYQSSYPTPGAPLSSKGVARASAQPRVGKDLLRAAQHSGSSLH